MKVKSFIKQFYRNFIHFKLFTLTYLFAYIETNIYKILSFQYFFLWFSASLSMMDGN